MTDGTQEIDEILDELINRVEWCVGVPGAVSIDREREHAAFIEAKQALLDWHNKQVEEVIKKPHILPKNAQHQESVKQGINFYHRQMRKRVDKLKESSNDKDS